MVKTDISFSGKEDHVGKPAEQVKSIAVLHVGPLPPPIGGMSIFFEQLVGSCLDGYAFSAVATNQIDKFKFDGWKRRCMNLVNAVLLTGRFLKALFSFRPRIVHVQTNSGDGFFEKASLLIWAKVVRAKTVLHIHGGGFRDFYYQSGRLRRGAIRFCLNRTDRIIVLSEQMKSDFEAIGICWDKLAIVPNGVLMPEQTTTRKTAGWGPDAPVTVLFLNRVDTLKGIQELLEAAELICRKSHDVTFQIVGPASSCHSRIMQALQEKNLLSQVHIAGPVTGQQKTLQYAHADIYVLPSYLEALPIGLLEAMACGLPCIATTVGAIPEIIEDGTNGLLIPVKDAQKLADALWRLICDSTLRERLGANARKTIRQQYTWRHTLKAVRKQYDSLIRQSYTGTK